MMIPPPYFFLRVTNGSVPRARSRPPARVTASASRRAARLRVPLIARGAVLRARAAVAAAKMLLPRAFAVWELLVDGARVAVTNKYTSS